MMMHDQVALLVVATNSNEEDPSGEGNESVNGGGLSRPYNCTLLVAHFTAAHADLSRII